jgi:hypothetical protein
MMFYGDAMKGERVYMAEPEDVSAFFQSVQTLTWVGPATDAPSINVGLYWNNPIWEPYLADPALLKTLPLPRAQFMRLPRPGSEDKEGFIQPARFYPAHADKPPRFGLMTDGKLTIRGITADGLALLKKYNVPAGSATRHWFVISPVRA